MITQKLLFGLLLLAPSLISGKDKEDVPLPYLYNHCRLFITGPSAPHSNPSLTALENRRSFAFSCMNLYRLADLNRISACLSLPVKRMSASFHTGIYGNRHYVKSLTGLAVAVSPDGKSAFSVGAIHQGTGVTGYGSQHTFGLQVSAFARLNRQTAVSFLSEDLLSRSRSNSSPPASHYAGIRYSPEPSVSLMAEYMINTFAQTDFRTAVHYRFGNKLGIAAGSTGRFREIMFGITWRKKDSFFSSTLSIHPVLGFSHQFVYSHVFPE